MNKDSPELDKRKARLAALAASYNDWQDDSYMSKTIDNISKVDVKKTINNGDIEIFKYSNKVLYDRPGSRNNSLKKKEKKEERNTPIKNSSKYIDISDYKTSNKTCHLYPNLDDLADKENKKIIEKVDIIKPTIFDISNKSEEDFKLMKTSPNTVIIEFKKPANLNQMLEQEDNISHKHTPEYFSGNETPLKKGPEYFSPDNLLRDNKNIVNSKNRKQNKEKLKISDNITHDYFKNYMTNGYTELDMYLKENNYIGKKNKNEADIFKGQLPENTQEPIKYYMNKKDNKCIHKICIDDTELSECDYINTEIHRKSTILKKNNHHPDNKDKETETVKDINLDLKLCREGTMVIFNVLTDESDNSNHDEVSQQDQLMGDYQAYSELMFQTIKEERQKDIESLSNCKIVSSLRKEIPVDNMDKGDNKVKKYNLSRKIEMSALLNRWEMVTNSSHSTDKDTTKNPNISDNKIIARPIPRKKIQTQDCNPENDRERENAKIKEDENRGVPEKNEDNNVCEEQHHIKITQASSLPVHQQIFAYDNYKLDHKEDVLQNHDLSIMVNNELNLSLRLSDFDKITEEFSSPSNSDNCLFNDSKTPQKLPSELTILPSNPTNKINNANNKPAVINKIITYDHQNFNCNEMPQSYTKLLSSSSNDNSVNKSSLSPVIAFNRENLDKFSSSEKVIRHKTYSERIKELNNQVEYQQTIITQISQALLLFRNDKKNMSNVSQERIEAEKLNFIARQKRQLLLSEIGRLKQEEKQILTKLAKETNHIEYSPYMISAEPSNNDSEGFLNITNIKLILKPDFLSKPFAHKYLDYYFLCLFKYGPHLVFTQLTPFAPNSFDTRNTGGKMQNFASRSNNNFNANANTTLQMPKSVNINNCINIHGMKGDWKIEFEVYTLYVKSSDKLVNSPHQNYNSPLSSAHFSNSPSTLLKKLTPSKKKFYNNSNSSNILVNKDKDTNSNFCNKDISEDENTNYSDAGIFVLSGFTTITKRDYYNRNRNFSLKRVPQLSPLQGSVLMNLKCHTQLYHRGFLNMFEVIDGLGSWNRGWFVLSGQYISYWKYPENENNKSPIGKIDLTACVENSVRPVSIEKCPRPNTLELNVFKESFCDKSIVLETDMEGENLAKNTLRYLLSTDNKEQLKGWCDVINKALSHLNTWDRNFPNLKNLMMPLKSTV
ncbi:unnamed protein product [Gordionus sp. m RMFG-2023]